MSFFRCCCAPGPCYRCWHTSKHQTSSKHTSFSSHPAGVWLALVKQAPQYAIGFMVYEQCKRALAL